jgi:hypothetical protein
MNVRRPRQRSTRSEWVELWRSLQPPPARLPTPEEAEEVRLAEFALQAEPNLRPTWQRHPHRDAWLRWAMGATA